MRRLRLWELAIRLGLHRVDHVGELDRILDEEHGDVVADQIPVALLRVELDREATHVAGEVERSLAPGDRREAHERRGACTAPLEEVGTGDVRQRVVGLEEPVGAIAPGVDDALGNPFVVEVEDLLAEVEVLECRRASLPHTERVLVVCDRHALLGRQSIADPSRDLMGFAAITRVIHRTLGRRRPRPLSSAACRCGSFDGCPLARRLGGILRRGRLARGCHGVSVSSSLARTTNTLPIAAAT